MWILFCTSNPDLAGLTFRGEGGVNGDGNRRCKFFSWELCCTKCIFPTKLFETALSDFSLARIKGTWQIIK